MQKIAPSQREFSLLILKPDVLERSLESVIMREFANTSLKPRHRNQLVLSTQDVTILYHESEKEPHYAELARYMTRGPVITYLVYGKNAVDELNALVGPTDPGLASIVTIRGKYGISILENSVHSSNKNRLLIEVSHLYKDLPAYEH